MRKEYRIKKTSEIDAIFKLRHTQSDVYFSIYQATNQAAKHFRFALSIGKKYGNAVKRNKIKRQIRMIMQTYHQHLSDHKEFLIIIKPKARTLSFDQIEQSLLKLLKKSKLLENNNE